jgi:hypothetical protein
MQSSSPHEPHAVDEEAVRSWYRGRRLPVNWTTELLRTLCKREALHEVERIINEQQGL